MTSPVSSQAASAITRSAPLALAAPSLSLALKIAIGLLVFVAGPGIDGEQHIKRTGWQQ